jgi:hypothetical protein
MDLQILVPSLGITLDRNGNATSSPGDPGVRWKWNLMGNDGEGIGMALMPWFFVGGGDLRAGGGLIVPVSIPLPGDFGLGTMAVVNYVPVDGGGHAAELLASASIGHDIVGDLAGYVEVLGGGQPRESTGELLGSVGLTYGLTDDVQLDGGARGPLVGDDARVESFLGLSVRQ